MRWKKHDEQTIKSDDGAYAISRFSDGEGEWFEVWRTRAHVAGPHLVAHNVATSQEARALALADDAEA